MTPLQVPLLDLKAQHASIRGELDAAIARVMERGQFVMADEVEAFEEEWARYCGATYAVGVSSGSDALYLCLRYLQEREHYQDCYTTPLSFWATTEAAIRAGYSVRFADVRSNTGCLDPDQVVEMGKLSVYLPVHLYGYPATLESDTLSPSTVVLEDASHAHGQPRRGWAACFSHYPTKNLGALGQGGSVVTNDGDLYDWLMTARHHSEAGGRFQHWGATGNFRLDELQAAVLRAKLPYLAGWTTRRREVAAQYDGLFSNLQTVGGQLPHPQHTYHIYSIRVKERDALAAHLKQAGIQTAVRYSVPLHQQPYWEHLDSPLVPTTFPEAEAWCREVLNLPIYETMPDEAVEYVADQVKLWVESQP